MQEYRYVGIAARFLTVLFRAHIPLSLHVNETCLSLNNLILQIWPLHLYIHDCIVQKKSDEHKLTHKNHISVLIHVLCIKRCSLLNTLVFIDHLNFLKINQYYSQACC
jgi:hypothetical protein